MLDIVKDWFGGILVLVAIVSLLAFIAYVMPGCDERMHRNRMGRMEACTASCGTKGVLINEPSSALYSCVCRP